MYKETKEVVRRLFCLLKLNSWKNGRMISIIDVRILTHRDEPHTSAAAKYMYPKIFKKTATPSKMRVSPMRVIPQQVSPLSNLATNLIPAK